MQTLTIKCDNAILPHLTKILKSINGVDIDTKIKKSKKRDLKSELRALFEKHKDVKPFSKINDSVAWQRGVRDEW